MKKEYEVTFEDGNRRLFESPTFTEFLLYLIWYTDIELDTIVKIEERA